MRGLMKTSIFRKDVIMGLDVHCRHLFHIHVTALQFAYAMFLEMMGMDTCRANYYCLYHCRYNAINLFVFIAILWTFGNDPFINLLPNTSTTTTTAILPCILPITSIFMSTMRYAASFKFMFTGSYAHSTESKILDLQII